MFTEDDKKNLLLCIDITMKQEGLKSAAILLALAQKVQDYSGTTAQKEECNSGS